MAVVDGTRPYNCMKNRILKRARQGLLLSATVVAGLLVWSRFGLVPESAPVARGASANDVAQTNNAIP